MLQLSYISTARTGLTEADIARILGSARRNNAQCRITGMLIHDGWRFLQALEGDADSVEAAFARICADARHHAVAVLSRKAVAVREFGDWAMACHMVGETGDIGSMAATIDALTEPLPDAGTRDLFRSFARVERRAA